MLSLLVLTAFLSVPSSALSAPPRLDWKDRGGAESAEGRGDRQGEKGEKAKRGDPNADRKVERVTLPRKEHPLLFMELTLANPDPLTPMLVLFHQAGSSKGEYRPIVPHLKELGYNCLAVDLSSGAECREIKNQTAKNALDGGRNPTYLDALPDILDALIWARANHATGKLVAWGSSYSASLALVTAAAHPDLVDGVLAFSPGEYFAALGKPASWIHDEASKVECPAFLGAARSEEPEWKPIFEALASKVKVGFVPVGPGMHGSRALWPESQGNEEYWVAVEAFLKTNFPVATAATPPVAPPIEAPKKDG